MSRPEMSPDAAPENTNTPRAVPHGRDSDSSQSAIKKGRPSQNFPKGKVELVMAKGPTCPDVRVAPPRRAQKTCYSEYLSDYSECSQHTPRLAEAPSKS